MEPTFVFSCNFLILSPVRVVFTLYYLEKLVCLSEAEFLLLDVEDPILKSSNHLLHFRP